MTNVNGNYKKKLKKTFKKISKKTTGEQRFLGKTLPKALFKTAKWAFKHPISATALTLVPAAIRKIGTEKIAKRSAFKTFDKKGRWML